MNTENTTPETSDENPGRPSFLDEILSSSTSDTAPVSASSAPVSVDPIIPSQRSEPAVASPTPVAGVSTLPASSKSSPDTLQTVVSEIPPPAVPTDSTQPLNMLDQVIASSASTPPNQPETPPAVAALPQKKIVTPGQILRMIGALFFVSLVFFGSFLAYIVFNPGQAKFFINFGINPADVASLLSSLVNGIFGALSFVLSTLFIYTLFKAYLSKGAPKKRAIFTVSAVSFGVLLFSNIGFWAYLFGQIWAQDFVRPTGGVIVYDNDLWLSKEFRDQAELTDLSSLVGPISIKYDLSSDVLYASKTLNIEWYFIDCNNENQTHEGSSPATDASIICKYSSPGNYAPTGYYRGSDRVTREPKRVEMALDEIKVVGLVDIQKVQQTMVFDATELKNVGNVKWYIGPNFDTAPSEDPKYSVKIQDIEQYLCLELQTSKRGSNSCSRIFTIASKIESVIQGKITYKQDLVEPTKYSFKLENLSTRNGAEIDQINWYLWDSTTSRGKDDYLELNFNSYGTYKISAVIQDNKKNSVTLSERIVIERPLQLTKKGYVSLLKVEDESRSSVISDTFDRELDAYRISWLSLPQTLTFDATDVRVKNEGYELKEVLWKIDTEERKGLKIDVNFVEEKRYEVAVTYVFVKPGTTNEVRVPEKIIIEGRTQEIVPSLQISSLGNDSLDGLFAEVDVKFDASASKVKTGKISQFIFDFGEGKPPSVGEAVKTYRYAIPGNYTIKLTVVKTDGGEQSISRTLVIKELPKKLEIWSSVSQGIVGKPVDFMITGTVGQVASSTWDFGDGSPAVQETNPTHVFEKSGNYTVKISASYADGTIRNAEVDFVVTDE